MKRAIMWQHYCWVSLSVLLLASCAPPESIPQESQDLSVVKRDNFGNIVYELQAQTAYIKDDVATLQNVQFNWLDYQMHAQSATFWQKNHTLNLQDAHIQSSQNTLISPSVFIDIDQQIITSDSAAIQQGGMQVQGRNLHIDNHTKIVQMQSVQSTFHLLQ